MGGMGRGRGRGMDNRFGGEWGPGVNRFDGTTYIIPADKCGLVIGKGKSRWSHCQSGMALEWL